MVSRVIHLFLCCIDGLSHVMHLMNKYIYKVKFVFKFLYTTEQRVMHKDELIFGKQQQF